MNAMSARSLKANPSGTRPVKDKKGETYQTKLPLQILRRELLPLSGRQLKLSTDFGLPNALRELRDAASFHARLFESEVEDHADTGHDEEEAGFP